MELCNVDKLKLEKTNFETCWNMVAASKKERVKQEKLKQDTVKDEKIKSHKTIHDGQKHSFPRVKTRVKKTKRKRCITKENNTVLNAIEEKEEQ